MEHKTLLLKALNECEEKFRAITGSTSDAIILINNEGKITYWNATAENMFGYTTQEVMGKELHSFIIPHRYREAYKGIKDIH